MNTIELTLLGETNAYSGPSTWEELTPKQYEGVCKILLLLERNPEARLMLPALLYRIPLGKLSALFDVEALRETGLSAELVANAASYGQQLIQTCQWVFESLPQKVYPQIDPHRPGPGDGLRNCTFEEFLYAESCYERFRQSDNDHALLKLIAVLHRKRKGKAVGDEDPRLAFQPSLVDRNANRLKKMPYWQRFAVLWAYEGARLELASHFRYVFPKQVAKTSPSKGSKNPGWFDVALNLAGDDIAKFETNNRANVYLVLAMVDKAIQRQEELEASMP